MTDFVGDDIGLGELAGFAARTGAKPVLQIVKERRVEIDALVARAIEWAHRRPGISAWRWLGPGKQTQLRRMIGSRGGGKDFRPAILGVADNRGDELSGRIVRRAGGHRWRRAGLLYRPAAENLLRTVDQHASVSAEIPTDQRGNDHNTDANPAGAAWHAARCARFAIIFDVGTASEIISPHGSSSRDLSAQYQTLRESGTFPPFSASLIMTCLCNQTFIAAESFIL